MSTAVEWSEVPYLEQASFSHLGRARVSAAVLTAIGANDGDAVLVVRGDGSAPCICMVWMGRSDDRPCFDSFARLPGYDLSSPHRAGIARLPSVQPARRIVIGTEAQGNELLSISAALQQRTVLQGARLTLSSGAPACILEADPADVPVRVDRRTAITCVKEGSPTLSLELKALISSITGIDDVEGTGSNNQSDNTGKSVPPSPIHHTPEMHIPWGALFLSLQSNSNPNLDPTCYPSSSGRAEGLRRASRCRDGQCGRHTHPCP